MSRFTQSDILLIVIVALLLFGLASAPGLASSEVDPPQSVLQNLYDITVTPIAIAFLPIVTAPPRTLTLTPIMPPPASLAIVALSYSGIDEAVTIRNSGGSAQLLNA